MFLSLTTTGPMAQHLGWLLHKHPDRVHTIAVSGGEVTVVYPTSTQDTVTMVAIWRPDPIEQVRGKRDLGIDAYINAQSYAVSSLWAQAIGKVFATAVGGTCNARPDWPEIALPITITVGPVRVHTLDQAVALFGPLGYHVSLSDPVPVHPTLDWGAAPHRMLTLVGELPVYAVLRHLLVLLPVFDGRIHQFVDADYADRLDRLGTGWLSQHPEHDAVVRMHLRRMPELLTARVAPRTIGPLASDRHAAVLAELVDAASVCDLGCGEGALLSHLLLQPHIVRILGIDADPKSVERARKRLHMDTMGPSKRARIEVLQGALTYQDPRLEGFDAAVLMEVVEHLDPWRLHALENAVFDQARPKRVIVTTPNHAHNRYYPGLKPGQWRHPDHRFEWTMQEGLAWGERVAADTGYHVRQHGVGTPIDGSWPTQMLVFTRGSDLDAPT